jgi:hypothetical protein
MDWVLDNAELLVASIATVFSIAMLWVNKDLKKKILYGVGMLHVVCERIEKANPLDSPKDIKVGVAQDMKKVDGKFPQATQILKDVISVVDPSGKNQVEGEKKGVKIVKTAAAILKAVL